MVNPHSFFVCPNIPIDIDLSKCISTLCDLLKLIYNKLYDHICVKGAFNEAVKKVDSMI